MIDDMLQRKCISYAKSRKYDTCVYVGQWKGMPLFAFSFIVPQDVGLPKYFYVDGNEELHDLTYDEAREFEDND